MILSSIRNIIIRKELDIEIHKVKGHSGCKWNDITDTLAKEGRDLALLDNNRIIDIIHLGRENRLVSFIPT